jgi:protoporphyrin/coproporphyrin ferrochelatase
MYRRKPRFAMNEVSSPSVDSTHRPSNHPPVASGRVGVLIVNLGTPDATDARSVRRYLKEFLSDRRVIEESGLLWKIILHGFILTFRPRTKGPDYERIWNREGNESPLKTISRSQAEKLAIALAPLGLKVVVGWAMRYGNPSVASRLDALARAGCDRVLIVPLYPQYAAATTASVCDEVFRCLMRMRWQPTVRVAPPYFDDADYIEALATSLQATLDRLAFRPEIILASYHGIPKDYFLKGDPYYCHCAKTTRLLRERLELDENKLIMTFQSRFGRAEWLKPYTIGMVQELAERGCKNLLVITPGFSADCLETLEEIAVENGAVFKKHGGENFAVVPCLNDSELGMRVIEAQVARELKGWV